MVQVATIGYMEQIAGELDAATDYYEHHPDVGCKYSASCQNCTLLKCIEDMNKTERLRIGKLPKITEALWLLSLKHTVREVADMMGVTRRTIYRWSHYA